ncbi:MAG: phosphatase PAP2 family protein [Planctomycetota bacterium]
MAYPFPRAALLAASTAFCVSASFAPGVRASVDDDVVLFWNSQFGDLVINSDGLENPGASSRAMAMMNLAIYDSVALSSGTDAFYTYDTDFSTGDASSRVAASQAAYTVLSSIYGGTQQAKLDSLLEQSLGLFADGASKSDGISLGSQVADSIITKRSTDGYDTYVQYTPSGEIGRWGVDPVNPDQEAWGPNWGNVQTFAIDGVSGFLPVAPPAITSQAYADAYNEVRALGSIDSATRTAEQTEIGLFWAYDREGLGTPLSFFNQAVQSVAEQEGNTFEENAELFAMASVAMADAGIVAWNSKFEYDLWRPVSGIRQGDEDGNDLTDGDLTWTPLGAPDGEELTGFTPPFPTYVSGHATFGGALFEVLTQWYGEDLTFTLTSEELLYLLEDGNEDLLAAYGLEGLEDAERTFTFSEAALENSDSRVYLGIHWNYDSTEGQLAGELVAASLFHDGFFAAVPEPASILLLGFGALLVGPRRHRSV